MPGTIVCLQSKTEQFVKGVETLPLITFYLISENGEENFDWTGNRTRDLWITVQALSHMSYPALWMVAALISQLFFAGVGAQVRGI